MIPNDRPTHIGITAPSDHSVFSRVGDELENRGHVVTYLDPNTPIGRADLERLSLFVSKQTRPASVRALLEAERLGVSTWNSATGVVACVSRFSQLCLLEGVGFDTPAASTTRPEEDYVSKGRYHWQMAPDVNGTGDLYEELLPADPVDFKYYVVDTGSAHRVTVLRATSKLWGEKRVVGEAEPVPEHVDLITSLMERLGMRAIGVDLVRTDDGWFAVDLNPCPGFEGAGLVNPLVESIESCLE